MVKHKYACRASPRYWFCVSLLLLFGWVSLTVVFPDALSPWRVVVTTDTHHTHALQSSRQKEPEIKLNGTHKASLPQKENIAQVVAPREHKANLARKEIPSQKTGRPSTSFIAKAPTILSSKTFPPVLPTRHPQSEGQEKQSSSEKSLMVALAARQAQVEDVLVVINSTISHSSQRERLLFRIVTEAEEASTLMKELTSRLPHKVDLETVAFDTWMPRVSQLVGGKSSQRKELFDELNFAAFYLHEVFPKPPGNRVLYLDTDVVVLGDLVKELVGLNLADHPLAAARDCSQHVGKYIDFAKLKKKGIHASLPHLRLQPDACVVNRGVVLVNTKKWRSENLTGTIEALVSAHLTKGIGPLWRSGVSQPPFLLAANQKYLDLGPYYNIRGLGRGNIGPEEVDYYRSVGLWTPYLDLFTRKCKYQCCAGCKGWSLTPYISPNAHKAKILHFNGGNKPKKAGRRSSTSLSPPPKQMDDKTLKEREQRPLCSCGERCVQECAGIWWKYLPPD